MCGAFKEHLSIVMTNSVFFGFERTVAGFDDARFISGGGGVGWGCWVAWTLCHRPHRQPTSTQTTKDNIITTSDHTDSQRVHRQLKTTLLRHQTTQLYCSTPGFILMLMFTCSDLRQFCEWSIRKFRWQLKTNELSCFWEIQLKSESSSSCCFAAV